jgi:hypothetical protein
MTLHLIFHYSIIYLVIGFVSAFIIDQVIRSTRSCEPYTGKELLVVMALWPINVAIFVYSFIVSLFR